jgi:hypothetical protein
MPADLKRLHKYMLEVEHISVISDEMRVPGAGTQAAAEEVAMIRPKEKPRPPGLLLGRPGRGYVQNAETLPAICAFITASL